MTVTTDADRPNLRLTVVRARPGERLEAMIAWAKRHKGSGIIYKENRKAANGSPRHCAPKASTPWRSTPK